MVGTNICKMKKQNIRIDSTKYTFSDVIKDFYNIRKERVSNCSFFNLFYSCSCGKRFLCISFLIFDFP